ncbi:Zn-dependent hydrolase [Candidimonas sp. SYP-B2681]|uniref:M20 family metallo-hydrolase n=1 Tax=Candidimonas sp. SYP-B2681 TaxID=2497686 RepID=UPI000F88AC09|nr:M20 family metallo-hydrolase [Candidimonas sp. SYP-B2681]RTZ45554.1 Zn-dependent hydrolase [Candidimonas sp. SYP-B2681]
MNQHDTPVPERAQDHVNASRLLDTITALAAFGGRDDGGVSRQTLTDIDLASRRYLIEQARALGCDVSTDECANLFFRRPGRSDLPPVLTGSHADTQPVGGKLDGAYGVLAGLEVIAALNDAGIETLRPIEVVAWTNEEGSRFGPGAMGSSAFVDPTRLAEYRRSIDGDGISFGTALDKALAATADVQRSPMARPMAACLELHIEQGPILEADEVPLGVVNGIQSVRWYRVECRGVMAHAGTTPMDRRSDAMATAHHIAQQLYSFAQQEASTQLRLTLGRWVVEPNSVNTIPDRVEFTVDVRCVDESVLDRFETMLNSATAAAVSAPGAVALTCFFRRAPTHFPEEMKELVQRACSRASAQAGRKQPIALTSGAFHDAMYLADHCPTGMIFVPSKGGISHNASEATAPEDLVLGVQALAYAVAALADS